MCLPWGDATGLFTRLVPEDRLHRHELSGVEDVPPSLHTPIRRARLRQFTSTTLTGPHCMQRGVSECKTFFLFELLSSLWLSSPRGSAESLPQSGALSVRGSDPVLFCCRPSRSPNGPQAARAFRCQPSNSKPMARVGRRRPCSRNQSKKGPVRSWPVSQSMPLALSSMSTSVSVRRREARSNFRPENREIHFLCRTAIT